MFHFQSSVNDWPRAVSLLPDGSLIKAIDRGDILRDVKLINPNITTALRHYGGPQNIFDGRGFEAYKSLARQFFSTFIDTTFREQYARYTDIVIEWNEYLATSHTGQELQDRIDWAHAAAWVWRNEYRTQEDYAHIRLGLLSCPVGNDIHRAFAEIALQYDCVLSYHAYDKHINGTRDPGSWRWHCGRWNYMEQAWGLKPDWMFGEAGPYSGVENGWRHSTVLGGNQQAYVDAMRRWIREIKTTPAYAERRVLGFNLFTTGGTDEWKHYETRQNELDMLAAMIAQEWKPVPLPPPPPPPPPDPELEPRRYHRTCHLLPQDATLNEMDAVLHAAYGERQTVLFSADDAFSKPPEITGRTVYVWEIERVAGSEKALKDWVNVHFPPWPTRSRFRRIKDLFVADRWDAPIGTKAERDGDKMPPGDWVVSTEFNQRYQIVSGGSFHRHTGWDLNNQSPYWDSDRNMPIRACANGRVIHMVEFPDSSSWGKVIVTEHVKPDGQVVHSRHAHMAEFAEGLEVGHWIRRGTLLGTTGRTNVPNGAYHHHWDISLSGVLVEDPGHWCFDNAGCVTTHYVNPGLFVQANR